MGQVIDSRRVPELPVPHGNPMFLDRPRVRRFLQPDQRLDRPFEPTHIVGYSMDGTRGNRSDVTLDGAPSHGHRERRRGHRVLRSSAPTSCRSSRCRRRRSTPVRPDRRRRNEHQHQVRHQRFPRHRLTTTRWSPSCLPTTSSRTRTERRVPISTTTAGAVPSAAR